MKKAVVLAVVFCFIFSMTAQAKNVWDMAQSPRYGEKAGGMLARGLFNVVTCFVDIPVQTVKGAQESKPEFIGAVGGFAKGATCTVLRAASGVIDVATFWIPSFHGLPVSRSYENCLAAQAGPEYVAPSGVYPASPVVVPQDNRLKYVKK